jgi:hypothetical protein
MSDTPSFIEVATSWLPMLLLIAVFIWYSRRITGQRGRLSMSDYMEQHIVEIRRHNAVLEQILLELKSGRVHEGTSNNTTSL